MTTLVQTDCGLRLEVKIRHLRGNVFEAFGTRPKEIGSTQDRQKANTKDEEPEAKIINEGFRWRDLETGTFLTRDPLGFVDGPNMYSYVNDNPWTKFDPEGLFANFIVGAGVGAGIDLSAQLIFNGGNFKAVNWASVGISAGMGATGVGLGEVVSKSVIGGTATAIATRAALNAAGGAAIGAAGQTTLNAVEGKPLTNNLGTATALNAVTGGAGSVVADGFSALSKATANSAFEQASINQKLLGISNGISGEKNPSTTPLNAAGNVLGMTISNTAPLAAGAVEENQKKEQNKNPTESARTKTESAPETKEQSGLKIEKTETGAKISAPLPKPAPKKEEKKDD